MHDERGYASVIETAKNNVNADNKGNSNSDTVNNYQTDGDVNANISTFDGSGIEGHMLVYPLMKTPILQCA